MSLNDALNKAFGKKEKPKRDIPRPKRESAIVKFTDGDIELIKELCYRFITQYSVSKCYKKDGSLNASGRVKERVVKLLNKIK